MRRAVRCAASSGSLGFFIGAGFRPPTWTLVVLAFLLLAIMAATEQRRSRDPHAETKPEQHPPEQERAREIAEAWLSIPQSSEMLAAAHPHVLILARAYLALLSGWSARAQAEQDFLDASVAVWREIDRLSDEPGGYRGLGPGNDLRVNERFAWEAYKDALNTADCPEASDGYAEHLREARAVEQHQEEKHGDEYGE